MKWAMTKEQELLYERIRKLELWQSEHNGICGERHKDMVEDMADVKSRVRGLEIKVAGFAGLAALIGSLVGTIVNAMLH